MFEKSSDDVPLRPALQFGYYGSKNTLGNVLPNAISGNEGNHGPQRSLVENDLNVAYGRFRCGYRRETFTLWVSAEKLSDDGGLAGTGGPHEKDTRITV
ncbi:MAG TPA: hypothetical protein PKX94_01640 [Opitutales bacterium]|nr:hypothetical protein [Opitutales bacterium]